MPVSRRPVGRTTRASTRFPGEPAKEVLKAYLSEPPSKTLLRTSVSHERAQALEGALRSLDDLHAKVSFAFLQASV